MLFMGEEWAASTPFQFFTSHPEPELGKATAEGRIEEFERMGWDPAVVPDPQDPATFQRSKLDWSELAAGRHAVLLDVYRRLAGAAARACPSSRDPSFASTCTAEADEGRRVFALRRGDLLLAVNFGDVPVDAARARASCSSRRRPRRSPPTTASSCRRTAERCSDSRLTDDGSGPGRRARLG